MKMIILGGGCFWTVADSTPTWTESTLQTLKNKYLKKLVNDIEMSQAWSIAHEDMVDLCLQTKRFRFE